MDANLDIEKIRRIILHVYESLVTSHYCLVYLMCLDYYCVHENKINNFVYLY